MHDGCTRKPWSSCARVISDTAGRGATVIVPSFAVGRAQELIWTLHHREEEKLIPSLSVIVDSPMACESTAPGIPTGATAITAVTSPVLVALPATAGTALACR